MIIPNLLDQLRANLIKADEIWVAVALMNDFGLQVLHEANPLAIKNIIVGIDLPTSPMILRKLLKLQTKQPNLLSCKIFNNEDVFHPKVYIIKKQSGELISFVGSANATNGGLFRNVEMNYCITCQEECKTLLTWFNSLFAKADFFNEGYIDKYKVTYRRNKALASSQKSNIDKLKNLSEPVSGSNLMINTEQFFRQADFDAFSPMYHLDNSRVAVNLRSEVKNRLLFLNNLIYPRFDEFGINDLHLPASRMNYTSYHWHARGYNHIPLGAIWLNYGKSVRQLEASRYKKFVENIRIQIILRNTIKEAFVGIWLFIGKKNGSYADRIHLKKNLNDLNFLSALYEYLFELGGAYWIKIGDKQLDVSDITSKSVLNEFLSKDDFRDFYSIGRNYQPNDTDLSMSNIEETVLTEFSKLFKIYDLIRAR